MWYEFLRPYMRYARLRGQNAPAPFVVDDEVIRTLRDLDYVEQWRLARDKGWYHLYLEDHSFFSFNTTYRSSYAYFHSPIEAPTFADYLEERGFPLRRNSYQELELEYGEVLETAPLKRHITPIRYDFDPDAYRSGVHPAAHIHLGLDNEIRIGLKRELNPIAFFLFVLRQMYPWHWEHLIDSPTRNVLAKRMRADLTQIHAAMLLGKDQCEMYLE